MGVGAHPAGPGLHLRMRLISGRLTPPWKGELRLPSSASLGCLGVSYEHESARILFGREEGGRPVTCCSPRKPWGQYAKGKQPDSRGHTLCGSPCVRSQSLLGTEMGGGRGARAGGGVGRQCSTGTEFWEDKNPGDGWWHNIVNVFNATEVTMLQTVKIVYFIFHYNIKITKERRC